MTRRGTALDLMVALVIAGLAVALSVAGAPEWASPVRTLFGVGLVLFVPGYALTAALFPRNDHMDGIERAAMAVGLSVAVVPLIGLLLHHIGLGLGTGVFGTSLLTFATFAALVGILRRGRLPTAMADRGYSRVLTRRLPVLAACGAVLVAAAGLVGSPRAERPFTEFYLVGQDGDLASLPRRVVTDDTLAVRVAVGNQENEAHRYFVRLPFEHGLVRSPVVQPGETWHHAMELAPPQQGGERTFTFHLHRNEIREQPYRQIGLTVRGMSQPSEESSRPPPEVLQ